MAPITFPALEAYAPVLVMAVISCATMVPSFFTPVFTVMTLACRTRVDTMHSRRVAVNFTGLRHSIASTAGISSTEDSIFPPNAPPMVGLTTRTLLSGRPNIRLNTIRSPKVF